MRTLIAGRPLLAAALCFGAGVGLGARCGCSPLLFLFVFACAALGWLLVPRWREKGAAIFTVFLLVLIGAGLSAFHRENYRADLASLKPLTGKELSFVGMVAGEARLTPWGWRIPFRVERVSGRLIRPFFTELGLSQTSAAPPPGTVLRFRGRWSPTDTDGPPSWQERRGLLGRIKADRWVNLGFRPTLRGCLYRFKCGLESVGERTLSRRSSEVLHGMLFGEEFAEEDLTEDFRRAGVVHLLTVSGLHVGFLALLLTGLGAALRLPRTIVFAGVMAVIPLFILMVGAGPAATRAGIVTEFALLGLMLERSVDGLNIWGAAALTMLVFKPLNLFDPGFQLSFGASGGILWLFPRWRRAVPAGARWAADPFLVSLAAQVGVLPILAVYFGTASWISLFANIVAIPLSSAAVQLGFIAELLGRIWLPPAAAINACNELILQLFVAAVRRFSVGWAEISLPALNWWGVLLYYLTVVMIVRFREVNPVTRQRRITQLAQLCLVLILLGAGAAWSLSRNNPGNFRVVFFDVGQGDAALVTAPGGERLLIDGGPFDAYWKTVHPYLRRHAVRRIDLLLLTHAHEDHVGGLAPLLRDRDVQIDLVLDAGAPHTSRAYRRFLAELVKRKIAYRKARRGIAFNLGREVRGLILWPPVGDTVPQDLNHMSVVLKLMYKNRAVLMMGDADAAAEEELVRLEGDNLHAQVLKVGHHGSAYSSSAVFLRTVRPKVAVISVGKDNSFGHPSPVTLSCLKKVGAYVCRTDRNGRVDVEFMNDSQLVVRREAE